MLDRRKKGFRALDAGVFNVVSLVEDNHLEVCSLDFLDHFGSELIGEYIIVKALYELSRSFRDKLDVRVFLVEPFLDLVSPIIPLKSNKVLFKICSIVLEFTREAGQMINNGKFSG